MRTHIAARLSGFSLAAALLAATTLQAEPRIEQRVAECTATITDPLTIKQGLQTIKVTTSEELAGPVTAAFAQESNLTVDGAEKGTEKGAYNVRVDASKGSAGSWVVTLTSGEVSCKGEVKVAALQ